MHRLESADAASARWRILFVALLFSTGGVAIKGTDLNAWQVASGRSAIAALALFVFLPEARRAWSWTACLVGVAYATTLVTFVAATKLTTAANAIFLQSTAPLYLLLLGPWLLGERTQRRDLAFLALAAAGMGLCFVGTPPPTRLAPNPALGDAVAMLSGLAYALTIAGMRRLATRRGENTSVTAVVAGNVIAAVAVAPFAWSFTPATQIGTGDTLALLFLGVVQIGLAYAWMSRALPHVPAFEASLLLLAEPVFNPVWTWLLLGERPAGWAIVGGALILVATVLQAWSGRRGRRESHRKRALAEVGAGEPHVDDHRGT